MKCRVDKKFAIPFLPRVTFELLTKNKDYTPSEYGEAVPDGTLRGSPYNRIDSRYTRRSRTTVLQGSGNPNKGSHLGRPTLRGAGARRELLLAVRDSLIAVGAGRFIQQRVKTRQ